MQVQQAAKLRSDWGGKPCDHPKLVAEYEQAPEHNQARLTGDVVCVQCGATFAHAEADSFRRQERSR
jgi:hypothetical protein